MSPPCLIPRPSLLEAFCALAPDYRSPPAGLLCSQHTKQSSARAGRWFSVWMSFLRVRCGMGALTGHWRHVGYQSARHQRPCAERVPHLRHVPQDEAAAISGEDDPEAAARWALDRPGTATQWCLVKLGAAGALLVTRDGDSPLRHNSLKVRQRDSV